jgi:CspA family cold shock protein
VKGTVRRYLPEKRYGFVLSEAGDVEVFFHLSVFSGPTAVPPLTGEAVEYELEEGAGTRAVSVIRCDTPLHLEGTVTSYDPVRGYGFLMTDRGGYYLHKSEVIGGSIPAVGSVVHFYATGVSVAGKKPRACYVAVIP